jgi:hypothetical protein
MIPHYLVLRERLETEVVDIDRAAAKAARAYAAAGQSGPHQAFLLDAVAINLHGFYTAVERVLELLAREIDGGLPAGPAWHRDLLTQMALEVKGVRPAVIREETAARLGEYLRFRHLVRNLYTWDFAGDKLAELVASLDIVLSDLKADLTTFGHFLAAASRADESRE